MRDEAEGRIGHLYPKVTITAEMARDRPDLNQCVGQDLTVIAWLWARDVESPNPAYSGCRVPLVRSFWLSKKAGRQAWVEPVIQRPAKSYKFVVHSGMPDPEKRKLVDAGTKLGRGCKFRCALSQEPIPEDHIKEAGARGKLGTTLMAVVAEGGRNRVYLSPDAVAGVNVEQPQDVRGLDVPLANDPRNLWCLGYGLTTFDKLFTPRQLVALTTFCDSARQIRDQVLVASRDSTLPADERALADGGSGPTAYADSIATYLAEAVSKLTCFHNMLAYWRAKEGKSASGMGRQALPMTWDFSEVNPFAGAGGDFEEIACSAAPKVIGALPAAAQTAGVVRQLDATAINVSQPVLVSTDPPYYDNISYSDLSDYFYIWLRKALAKIFPALFATVLTPKSQELIATPYRHGGNTEAAQHFFENGLVATFSSLRKAQEPGFPLTVYYAFKQSETDDSDDEDGAQSTSATMSTGWETMLEGLVRSRFNITGTWPVRTENATRIIATGDGGVNALASSIVLVCRPRPDNAPLATRKDLMNALRAELPEALRNLQHGNIAPVDLAQAAIGPAMAVFTRYAKVVEADGSPMSVRTALGIINQVLDEVLAEQEGDFDPDTRWALAWFAEYGMNEGPFGVAETLSKAKNSAVAGLVEAGVVKARGGKVKLVGRDEMPDDWDPGADGRLTVWETTQHLIRALETQGESGAAALLARLGGIGETARELAYRLYTLCERKKWADEALAYNGLVIAWPELSKLAHARRQGSGQTQEEMF